MCFLPCFYNFLFHQVKYIFRDNKFIHLISAMHSFIMQSCETYWQCNVYDMDWVRLSQSQGLKQLGKLCILLWEQWIWKMCDVRMMRMIEDNLLCTHRCAINTWENWQMNITEQWCHACICKHYAEKPDTWAMIVDCSYCNVCSENTCTGTCGMVTGMMDIHCHTNALHGNLNWQTWSWIWNLQFWVNLTEKK